MLEHFAWIAAAMNQMGDTDLGPWDEEDGFFHDLLRLPDGSAVPLKVRSMVGLLPLAASSVFKVADIEHSPDFRAEALGFAARHESITATLSDIQRPDRRAHGSNFRCSARIASAASSPGCSTRVGDAEYAVATGRPSPTRGCSVATPTGGGRSGSR